MKESPHSISKILVDAYPNCSYLSGLLIRWRPYICPFHELVRYMSTTMSIMEVGCGIGLMTVLMAQLGKVKYGIGFDISRKAIDIARAAVIPHDCDIHFRCLSKDDPWPDGEFDTVVCVDVLHHIPRREQRDFIGKLAGVGKRSRIVFKDVSPKPFWKAFANVLHDLMLARQWIYCRSDEQVRKWFEEEEFSIIEHRRLDVLWYSHYLLVAEKKILPRTNQYFHKNSIC